MKQRMFTAIEENNVGLMKDIIDRYTNQEEFSLILDANGNSLVGLASIQGD